MNEFTKKCFNEFTKEVQERFLKKPKETLAEELERAHMAAILSLPQLLEIQPKNGNAFEYTRGYCEAIETVCELFGVETDYFKMLKSN